MGRKMNIGIMPKEQFREYTLSIARGEREPKQNEPKVWFDSVESMSQVLSTRNRKLLRIIKEQKPESLSELASASGRHVANLSRTLKLMEGYGIVKLERQRNTLKPLVLIDDFRAVFSL